jgi:pimeloyl-ACP methyl ester carboxylesterase
MTVTYSDPPNKRVTADNGIDYAYRETGAGQVPLVLLQHFRGNLDGWDPALIDALAASRHVVTFDNARVGGTPGTAPNVEEQMAHDAMAFLSVLELDQVWTFSDSPLAALWPKRCASSAPRWCAD